MSLIGIHVGALTDIIDIDKTGSTSIYQIKGLKFIQAFVSASVDYTNKKYDNIRKLIKADILKLVIHSSYSINLARNWSERDWWIQQFIADINATHILGGFAIVIHTGKQLEISEKVAINNMYTSLLYIHANTKHAQNIKILIETPSGQGTETLIDIDKMCQFISKFTSHPDPDIRSRFGMCLDTCHIFASGYDIRSKSLITDLFKKIDAIIGIDKIKLCHLNDSKNDLGSKIDRHENIGNGYIGKSVLMRIVKFFNALKIPIILETPSNGLIKDYLYLIQKCITK